MIRLALATLCLLPFAAAGQPIPPLPTSVGEAVRARDALERTREALEQVYVVPERPGQNRVAWYDFDWRFMDVPPPGGGPGGIRIYYYRSETAQLSRALPAIRSAYARLVDQFHYSPTKQIPYILFATQREFQTQNVFAVTESVLGVTSPEDLKMSVPYFGDHARFTEVSTHEMVHQFTIQKLLDSAGTDQASAIQFLPLWYIEGIAEYYAKGGIDTETDLFLRDLVANPDPRQGYEVLPFAEDRIRGYIPTYKLGQARVAFIAEVYGKEKIQAFLENAYLLAGSSRQEGPSTRGFGALVRRVLNEPIEQVDERWRAWMKRRYYAAYLEARQDLPLLKEIRGLGFEPEDFAASPDGSVVVVRGIDRRRGRARLYLVDLRNPKGAVEIASDNAPGTESLHPIEHSVAAVGSGSVVFAAQDGIGDTLYVRTFRRIEPKQKRRPPRISVGGRRTLEIRPPGGDRFIQVSDPALSPDEKELAFVGVARDGQKDVYTVSLKGGGAKRLTDDPYAERDVAWGDGALYFASDATDHGLTNLFRLDPSTGARTRLTTAAASDRHPAPTEDGKVYFSSDAAGKSDLYVLEGGAVRRITDFTTGLWSPALASKGNGLLASTFYGATFRLVEVPKIAWLSEPAVAVPPAPGEVLDIPEEQLPAGSVDYEPLALSNWSPDGIIVYGGAGGGSVAGRAAGLFSDTLRDHSVFVDLSVYGTFDLTQGIAIYQSRGGRTGWVAGAFHFVQLNIDRADPDIIYLQRDFGVLGGLRYPLDRFRRFDIELTVAGVRRHCPTNFSRQSVLDCGILQAGPTPSDPAIPDPVRQAEWEDRNGGVHLNLQPVVRFGYDTIRYDRITGPVAGRSLVLELGGGWLPGPSAIHGFARMDAQQYVQLVGRANIGLRVGSGTSFSGNEVSRNWERIWWLLPAYNLRGFYPFDTDYVTGRHYWVANLELQVPLDPILRLAIFDTLEGVAALDFGSVFDRFQSRTLPAGTPLGPGDAGAWDARTLTGVLGVNVLLGPLVLRLHFGHPFDIGGLETPAMMDGARWVTHLSLQYAFF